MISYFEDLLYKNHDRQQKEYKNATNQLKTYIVEGHLSNTNSTKHDHVVEHLKELDIDKEIYNYKVSETEDENLIRLTFRTGDLFVDAMNPRFWVIHTAIKAEHSDLFHIKLLQENNMDHVWLPIPFLKGLKKFGETYGLGISFTEFLNRDERDNRLFEKQDTFNLDIRRLYVNEMLSLFDHSELKIVAGINKVSILNYSEDENEDYIIDDITYAGKITGRGTSFGKHHLLTQNILSYYEKIINEIETKYVFEFDLENSQLKGIPIQINLHRKNVNIQKLVEVLFSGKKPFLLWGIPDWRSDSFCYVSAVDLHVGNYGHQIDFEITPKSIRVILPKDSCGNSIARLITNLHQSIDATSSIKGENDDELFTII